jgi:hypothetical protein
MKAIRWNRIPAILSVLKCITLGRLSFERNVHGLVSIIRRLPYGFPIDLRYGLPKTEGKVAFLLF